MKKSLIMFFMLLVALIMVPKTAHAAQSQPQGFQEFVGQCKFGGKYTVAYGRNNKGENIYAYSTDGKVFSAPQKLGLKGDPDYIAVGKNLYVLWGKEYKVVTDPAKLSSAKTVRLKASCGTEEIYRDTKKGILYIHKEKSFYNNSKAYLFILNKRKVKTICIDDVVKKKYAGKIRIVRGVYSDTGSFGVCFYGGITSGRKIIPFAIYSKNGKTFKKLDLPGKSTAVEICDGKLVAYHADMAWVDTMDETVFGYQVSNLEKDSKKRSLVYVYEAAKKKWIKKVISTNSAAGFIPRSVPFENFDADVRDVGYVDYDKGHKALVVSGEKKKTTYVLFMDGRKWQSALQVKRLGGARYTDIEIFKKDKKTYALEMHDGSEQTTIRLSQLVSGKWKKLAVVKPSGHIGVSVKSNIQKKGKTLYFVFSVFQEDGGEKTMALNFSTRKLETWE